MTLFDWLQRLIWGPVTNEVIDALSDWLEEKGDKRAAVVREFWLSDHKYPNNFVEWTPISPFYTDYKPFIDDHRPMQDSYGRPTYDNEKEAQVVLGYLLVGYLLRTEGT